MRIDVKAHCRVREDGVSVGITTSSGPDCECSMSLNMGTYLLGSSSLQMCQRLCPIRYLIKRLTENAVDTTLGYTVLSMWITKRGELQVCIESGQLDNPFRLLSTESTRSMRVLHPRIYRYPSEILSCPLPPARPAEILTSVQPS